MLDTAANYIRDCIGLDLQAGYQHSLVVATVKAEVEKVVAVEERQENPVVPSDGITLPETSTLELDLSPLYQTFPEFTFRANRSDDVRLNPFSYLESQVSTIHEQATFQTIKALQLASNL